MLPLVSVLVTAYNYERFLGEAIDSVLAQRYPQDRIEIVVVDDGSTDGTPDVIASYGERIRGIRQANAGVNAATARGLVELRGDLVAMLDADDAWHPDKLARQVAAFAAHPEVGLVTSDMEIVDGDGALLHPSYFTHHRVRPPSGAVFGTFLGRNLAAGSTIAFRAESIERLLPFSPEAPFQDWWIAARLAESTEVLWLDEALVRYRIHGDSLTHGSAARDLANARQDTRFRRWMLRNLDLDGAPLDELVAAFAMFEGTAAQISRTTGTAVREELRVTASDRRAGAARLAAARDALADGDRAAAGRQLIRALAADPFDAAARAGLRGVAGPEPVAGTLADLRGFAAVASLDELRRTPKLLRAWTDAFDAEADATLVILAGDDPAGIDWLERRAADLGDRAPDLLALPLESGLATHATLPAEVGAMLSDDPAAHAFARPVLGSRLTPGDVRRLAERVRSAAVTPSAAAP